ncbi:MAG TPA: GDSL-type esterase/lipase family protein [Gammaproteobacteria bacterium]|nr:GDSL-type esterase/lipase family protein [Gammaproteobacteria bacterium]
MINILCYGDSNTWGNIAGSRNAELLLAKRFDRNIRWTGVLQKLLGEKYHIIEAGLNGRNTAFDETRFVRPSRNGLATLPLILEMHYPLDLVIIMLGTNDAIMDFNATPEQTTIAIQKMIRFIKTSHLGKAFSAPKVLLISPAPIIQNNSEGFKVFFNQESITKTQQLAYYYKKLAHQESCLFIDAAKIATVSDDDGVHIEAESHRKLAEVIATAVQKDLNRT